MSADEQPTGFREAIIATLLASGALVGAALLVALVAGLVLR